MPDLGVKAAPDCLADSEEVLSCTAPTRFSSIVRRIAGQSSNGSPLKCIFLGHGRGICQIPIARQYLANAAVKILVGSWTAVDRCRTDATKVWKGICGARQNVWMYCQCRNLVVVHGCGRNQDRGAHQGRRPAFDTAASAAEELLA